MLERIFKQRLPQKISLQTYMTAFILIVAVFMVSMLWVPQDAHAVRVSLKRIVFEGNKRSENLIVVNNTAEEQTYRLGWRKYTMDEKKGLRAVSEGEDVSHVLWAEDMIRYAPRRITVPAGGSQQVRLLFRRPKELQEAEYRAHFWVVTESRPQKFSELQTSQGQAIRIAVQPAVSLPVFVRNGETKAESQITDAVLKKAGADKLNMSFTLHRGGNRSLHGDFDFVCNIGGQEIVLRQIKGISVYTEVSKRYLSYDIPLTLAEHKSCNNLTVHYRSVREDTQYKGETIASASSSL